MRFVVDKAVGDQVMGELDGEPNTPIEASRFQITDRFLAFRRGNVFKSPNGKMWKLVSFGPDEVPPGPTGASPDVNRNPYNFVRCVKPEPWFDLSPHPGHDRWMRGLFHGAIRFRIETLTPVFIPEHNEDRPPEDRTPRHFFRMRKSGESGAQYAIPGSSLKGVLRSMVEAAANDRFGVFSKENDSVIPYRRRAFQVGKLEHQNPDGSWTVRTGHQNKTRPCDRDRAMFLLNRRTCTRSPDATDFGGGEPLTLDADIIAEYRKNLEHSHYAEHFRKAVEAETVNRPLYVEWNALNHQHHLTPAQLIRQRELKAALTNAYRPPLPSNEEFEEKIREPLAELNPGTEIYYTSTNGHITSFGKNVNYLWPARRSIACLAGPFKQPRKLGLDYGLGLAERIFGFQAEHDAETRSHPFKAKVAVKTAWGPPAEKRENEVAWALDRVPHALSNCAGLGLAIELAPLTSPATRGKSRPMYLAGREVDGCSASYSDDSPELKGRKMYFNQHPPEGQAVWDAHRRQSGFHDKVLKQCPAPLLAVNNVSFDAEIEFDNLSGEELGVLLFVLGQETIHIGKGKPRGLGVCAVRGPEVTLIQPDVRYQSLAPDAAPACPASAEQESEWRKAFEAWCCRQAGNPDFTSLPHLQDFIALHKWPPLPSVRYYPPNFAAYSWMPDVNRNPDEPVGGPGARPPAMKRARDCE
ncbi:MAG: TIGR03986 family CRISPR-associated RAMP protein [Bryobacteraceae bacterium]|jgi:CRISPR-associated protein (TIGR03986 family)